MDDNIDNSYLQSDDFFEDRTEISSIYTLLNVSEIKKSISILKSFNKEFNTVTFEEKNEELNDVDETSACDTIRIKKKVPSLTKSSRNVQKNEDSINIDVDVLLGTVLSINERKDEFEASLVDSQDESKVSSARFSFEDIQYESDKSLISVGARFVWTIGKERKILNVNGKLKYGEIVNVSKIRFRRTISINKKKRKQIEEDAEFWTNFFAGLDSEN